MTCAQTAGITAGPLWAAVSLADPPGHLGTPEPLPVAPRGLSGPARPILSSEVRHSYGCALRTRGGSCDCQPAPDLRTTSRGFTYSLSAMLGEGHYEDTP